MRRTIDHIFSFFRNAVSEKRKCAGGLLFLNFTKHFVFTIILFGTVLVGFGQRSNLTIGTAATSGGSWSPTYNSASNTTYTFTPSSNNATINVTEIVTLLRDRYSNVTITTTCASCTQVGQVDFATALTTTNNGNGNRTLTVNGGGDVNISNAITLGFTDNRSGWSGNPAHSFVVNTAGNINVSAVLSAKGSLDVNSSNIMPDGGSVTLNSTAGFVRVTSQINTSGGLHLGSMSNLAALVGGLSGSISITGVGGVSVSAPLVALGRSNNNGAVTISNGNSTVTSGGGVNDGVSGVISGLNFTKSGVGVLRISGVNDYTGTTTISGGTLQLGSGSNIPDASALTLSATGTVLDMNGYSETIGSLASVSGFGRVTSSSAGTITLNTGGNNTGTTYTGLIEDGSGTLLLTKSGSGTFQLSTSANTYSGLTTVSAGILDIRHSASLGSVVGGTSVTSGASLLMYNNISVADESLTINGSANAGSLRSVSGTNVWGGTITMGSASTIYVDANTLTINPASGSAISGTNLRLTFNGGGVSTVSGTVSLGTGGITNDAGTLNLLTANTYSGSTLVNGGVVNVRDNTSLGTSAVTVANGATLQLQGGITVSNVLTISGLGVGSVGSLRSISGVNEYAGNITLSGVTPVRMNTDLNSLLISGNIIGGTTPLYFGSSAGSGSVTTTVSGVISGGGGSLTWGTSPTQVALNTSVVKDNNFLTLVLSSTSNSYTGATVLGSMNIPNGGSGGGALLLGASEVINNSSHIVFNGGSLNTGGNSETVGLMSLLQDGGTLTLGSSVHNLNFSGIGTFDYKTLTISGWQGTAGSTGTGGNVYVGSSLFFTRAQLDQIKFSYNSGTFSSIQLSSGELVPDVNTVSNRSNIRITTGATTNGSWSPAYNGTNNTTYTFTPSSNNATINVTEIVTLLRDRYSNVTINTSFTGATQVGQVDFATALTTTNNGNGNRTLTVNGGGDVNVSNAITLGFTDNRSGWSGNPAHTFVVNTAGNINVSAVVSAKGAIDVNYSSNNLPDGGSVTLNSTAGVVRVTSQINTSGSLHTLNTNLSSLTGGLSGAISITGVGGVSVSAPLVALGRTNGAVTISTGNAVVTSGGGVNDGVSGVISGLNFTKSGVGVLRISGLNDYTGTTTISGGTLQLGSGTNIPNVSAVYFTGGNLNDGGFDETMGALFLSNSATITLGNAAHSLTFASAGTFAGTSSTTMLSIVGYNGLDATTAVTTNGLITSTSAAFVTFNGKKQNTVIGGMSPNGRILYGMSGATGNPTSIFIRSAMTATQLGQIQFFNSGSNSYYSTAQKPVAGTNGEIVPNAPK